MDNNTFNIVRNQNMGPGGYKCHCCGPAPRDRKRWNRAGRSRIKNYLRKEDYGQTRLESITPD